MLIAKIVHKKIRLEFLQKDLLIVVSNSINEAIEFLRTEYVETSDLELEEQNSCDALTISRRSFGSILIFKRNQLKANYICHEVCHVTNALFEHAGIPLTDATDEAYCYHNDMLFRTVVEFCKENKLKIKL